MIALGFLNPILLWALPLAAVPILIHLLNRRRFQRVRWAAQEFLAAALKRNRRRLRMEQWLVLLLRTLAVLLLVFLVSRPHLTGSILGEQRAHHVVCVDDSASMAQRSGPGTVFGAGVERLHQLIDTLAESRQGDLLTVFRASAPSQPELAAVRVQAEQKQRLRDALAALRTGYGSAGPAAMLAAAGRHLQAVEGSGLGHVYLVSDLRVGDWCTADGQLRADVRRELDAFGDGRKLTLLSVAPDDAENLAIVGVDYGGRVALAGVPVDVTVEIENTGRSASRAGQVALAVDDRSRAVLELDALQPGERRAFTFSHVFYEPGFHGAVAELAADRYPVDDRRGMAVEVAEASHVLVVDGDPGDRPEEAESYFLAFALEHRESGIRVEVVPDHALADVELTHYDLIYLCNAPAPDAAVAARLEDYVHGGGGLVVFLGDQVHAARYNELLYRDGAGVLPAELGELTGDLDRPRPVVVADAAHETVSLATDALEQVLALVGVGRHFEVVPAADARVVLRIGNSAGEPLMLSRRVEGGGEVVLMTTTADTKWNTLARTPVYLILTQRMHQATARVQDRRRYNQPTTGELVLSLDPAIHRTDVSVRGLRDDALERTFSAAMSEAAGETAEVTARLQLPLSELSQPGLYELQLTEHDGRQERRLLSAFAPAAESRLERLSRAGWNRLLPEELRPHVDVVESEARQAASLGAGEGETWRGLAMAMVAVLLMESVLAWRFGRR